jgi:hypothetical protein
MGAPVLAGMGIGAALALAQGRDPLKAAAIGGVSGGMFGGSDGFGSGFGFDGMGFDLGSGALANTGTNSLNAGAGLMGGTGTAVGTGGLIGTDAVVSNNLQNVTGGVTGQGFSPYSTDNLLNTDALMNDNLIANTANTAQTAQVNPDFANITKSTPEEIASAQGGYEKPLYEKAFDSVVGFAEKNPIALASLGMTALGGGSGSGATKQVTQSVGKVAQQAYSPQKNRILNIRRA